MNWLDASLFVLDLISETNAFLRGFTMSEYVPLFSLLLLMGGVIFWFMLVVMFFTGLYRLVRKGVWAVIDWMTPEPAVELPEVVLPHTD